MCEVGEHLESITSVSATVHARCPEGALSLTSIVPDKIVTKYFALPGFLSGIIRNSLLLLCKRWSVRFANSGHFVANI